MDNVLSAIFGVVLGFLVASLLFEAHDKIDDLQTSVATYESLYGPLGDE